MKKFLTTLLSLALFIISPFLVSCKKEPASYTVYAPDGAPAVAIAKLIKDKENFGLNAEFSYNVVTSQEIASSITVKGADIVVMPVNAATKVFNKNGGYKLGAVITHGNFYLLSSFAVTDYSALKGKIILVPNQQNTVPDLTLKHSLTANGLEYIASETAVEGKVALKYFNAGTGVIAELPASGSDTLIGMLPEPAATALVGKKAVYANRLSVQEMYDATSKSYPQAVLMVKNSFIESNPGVLANLQEKFTENVAWVKANPSEAVNAVKEVFAGTTLTNLNSAMIEGCNIYWQGAMQAKQPVKDYVDNIIAISPSSANAVTDNFFCE